MDKQYQPHDIEHKWRALWDKGDNFSVKKGDNPFSIVLPPPNVTGSLHMGHAFQDTIMDIMTRMHRMQGDSTLWQPGVDHAGIATQMVVERQVNAQGKTRHDLGREAFVQKIWDWKEQSGNRIVDQMRILGCSCDYERGRFTMDEGLSEVVKNAFIKLHTDGLIYRGKRLVNWDPVLKTAVSDLEVEHKNSNGLLWHIRYPIANSHEHIVVATTRPETLFGDVAVAVHPEDVRYKHLIGSHCVLPLSGRAIPIIADNMVDKEFGSGCVKITPAHDFNDHEVGKRHNLPLINILHDDATLNTNVPVEYQGLDRFVARKKALADLKAQGFLEKEEPHVLNTPHGDRTGVVLEPYLTDQWFVKATELAKPAIAAVENGSIEFIPGNWVKLYFDWMYNIQDWCISRRLWWGHRIPAWYDAQGKVYVGQSEEAIRATHKLDANVVLTQDEDVLDTWFSSAFWPFSALGWPGDPVFKTHYPTDVLVTGFDIIFFWVARMIMMGLYFTKEIPFKKVYITGLIQDPHGEKMSKSKGNVIDPLDLIYGIDLEALVEKRTTGLMQPKLAENIAKQTRKDFPEGIAAYGTDALRFTLCALATPGREIRFDFDKLEANRHFTNKIWNAARFVFSQIETAPSKPDAYPPVAQWLLHEAENLRIQVARYHAEYRFDLIAKALYEFIWHTYCDWGLEFSKAVLKSGNPEMQNAMRHALLDVLDTTLRLLHPIMPFITEEIWENLKPFLHLTDSNLCVGTYPVAKPKYEGVVADITLLQEIIVGVRSIRSDRGVSPAKVIPLYVRGATAEDKALFARYQAELADFAKIEQLHFTEGSVEHAAVGVVRNMTLLVPLAGLIDLDQERKRLTKSLEQVHKDLQVVGGKLNNAGYMAKASESIVAKDRARFAELSAQKSSIEQSLQELE